MPNGPTQRPYYGRARIAGAILLFIVAGALVLIDAVSDKYTVDNITLGLMLGTASVLLGVEALLKRLS